MNAQTDFRKIWTRLPVMKISLMRYNHEIDCRSAHSNEGALELTIEMLRSYKSLIPGDKIIVTDMTTVQI